MTLTAERLREVLNYDPGTGVFTWLVTLSNRAQAGVMAGLISNGGCILIGIAGSKYQAHRLAWLYMTGEWPESQIDHRDNSRGNNRWENLRLATPRQNNRNMKKRRDNTSGFKCVTRVQGSRKWRARIHLSGGREIHLGCFDTKEEAHAAYVDAAEAHFGEFARAG